MSLFSRMQGQTRSALLCACLISLQLAGCASIVPSQADKFVDDASQALGSAQSSFAIEGRLLFKQGRRNDHLRFTWDHSEARDTLMLTAALGQGVARITREENAAQLESADGKKFAGRDWQALSQQVFGQALPLDELPQWLRGARPQWTGEKDGWKIAVTQAQRVKFKCSDTTAWQQAQRAQVSSALVPGRIEFSKDDISLSIIVETWGDDE
ncbi:MAG: outer membrane lipoprotein LolB [Rhodocyclaceae bacterium]|nr:outer membrane lipoprotein LolB [Rhodocyclaceae bacterium]